MQPVYINNRSSIHPNTGNEEQPYLSACEPDYKTLITNANLRRRMSHIIKMGVACGLECIGNTPADRIDAIITATGLGCLADTEKFMNTLLDQNEQMLNPTAFIQSTFNTIGGQIALLLQIHAYNVTYVHRGLSLESALLDGMMRIAEGNRNVLVGAMDELTPTSHTLQSRLGLLKGTQAGEGAQFFLLSGERTDGTCAELIGIDTFISSNNTLTDRQEASPAFTTSPADTSVLSQRIVSFLQRHGLTPQDIGWFVSGKNGNYRHDTLYTELENNLFTSALHSTFKDECGEYPTASAYALWKVAGTLATRKDKETMYALIYNHYQGIDHSLILIRTTI